jgi:hypothetical protein
MRQCHLLFAPATGNLCNQKYILPVNTFNSLVANGYFMGASSKYSTTEYVFQRF